MLIKIREEFAAGNNFKLTLPPITYNHPSIPQLRPLVTAISYFCTILPYDTLTGIVITQEINYQYAF